MKKIRQKLKNKHGFSFTELLVATIIMMLATGLLTQTLDLAIDQFYRSTQESEAQLLCSELSRFVEDELSYAEYHTSDGTYSGGTHNMDKNAEFVVGADGHLLVTSESYTKFVKGEDYHENDYQNGNREYYDIAGDGSYKVGSVSGTGSQSKYNLKAGYTVTPPVSGDTLTVTIKVTDIAGKQLTENAFAVRPLRIIS